MKDTVVEILNLKKQFSGLIAVDNISFDICKGEIFGLLGPNGAGKTTAINMICGLLPQDSGEIIFHDAAMKTNNARRHIGVCPQENVFWPKLTCFEQLVFCGRMYDVPVKRVKQRAHELLNLMGLEEKSGAQAKTLSGGMKRRLNISLALIHDPSILIFDEPEAGLDPQSRILVREFIKSLAKQKTVILTTHNMDEADRLADRTAIIDHGKLLSLDSPENLKKSIGEGDLLEIVLQKTDINRIDAVIADLTQRFDRVDYHDFTLFINSKNLIEFIAEITNEIKTHDLEIMKMTIRENTLEDVFIHLTGRKLRQ